ncbi:hypothetical protein D3C72_849470 [compost metagenome]
MHDRTIGVRAQHDVAEFLWRIQHALDRKRGRQFLLGRTGAAAKTAGRHLHVLRRDGRVDVRHRQAHAQQFLRVDPHAHGRFGAKELHLAHAFDAADFVVDVARGVVRQAHHVLVRVFALVGQRVDHQEVRAGLLHLQALLRHRLRQACFRFLDAVLHVHLRQVRVHARFERDGDFSAAARTAGRLVIQHVLGAVQLFFDDARHRIHQHRGRRAGIGGGNGHLGRRHHRKLRHRQRRNRQQARQRNEDGHHPRKIGAANKKLGHDLPLGMHAVRGRLLSSRHGREPRRPPRCLPRCSPQRVLVQRAAPR